MNTEKLITSIRGIISTGASISTLKVFSPDLDLDTTNACAISTIAGDTTNNMSNEMHYYDLTMRCLIRGNESDTETRALADKIFNALHLQREVSFTGGKILHIVCQAPIFVYKDENGNNIYNITFSVKGE